MFVFGFVSCWLVIIFVQSSTVLNLDFVNAKRNATAWELSTDT
jgi:hypothetical protein